MQKRQAVRILLMAAPLLAQCHPAAGDAYIGANNGDWPADGRFSFEIPLPANLDTARDVKSSPLVAAVGDVYTAPPAKGVVEPFALGMTGDQVDAIIATKFPDARADGYSRSCRETPNDPRHARYRVIPRQYQIGGSLDPRQFELHFVDDGGIARLSSIRLILRTNTPGAGALVNRLAALADTRADPLAAPGCSIDRATCARTTKPGASFQKADEITSVVYTVSIGGFATARAGDIALRQTALGTNGDCTRLLGKAQEDGFSTYVADLGNHVPLARPIAFRLSDLPEGMRGVVGLPDKHLVWVRPLGSDYLAKYTWLGMHEPAAIMFTEFVLFERQPPGDFKMGWQWSPDRPPYGPDLPNADGTLSPERQRLIAGLKQSLAR